MTLNGTLLRHSSPHKKFVKYERLKLAFIPIAAAASFTSL